MMGTEVARLPWIDFSGVDPSAPSAGTWSAVRAQVMDAFASFGGFDAHYPSLTPELRAALFDGAVKPLFSLPVNAKRRNYYGPEKPFHGYLGELQGLDGQESLAIVDASKPETVRAFADLMWPDGSGNCRVEGSLGIHVSPPYPAVSIRRYGMVLPYPCNVAFLCLLQPVLYSIEGASQEFY